MTQLYWNVPPRILFPNPAEELTGLVQGKRASDLEERSARSISKIPDWSFTFRVRINPITHRLSEVFTNMRGELEIDFLAIRGRIMIPIMVDGEISHYMESWQREVDLRKRAEVDDAMRAYGALPTVSVAYYELANQVLSDRYYRELLQ